MSREEASIWVLLTVVNAGIWFGSRRHLRKMRQLLFVMRPENLDEPGRSVAEVLRETPLPLGEGATAWMRDDEAVVLARALVAAGLASGPDGGAA